VCREYGSTGYDNIKVTIAAAFGRCNCNRTVTYSIIVPNQTVTLLPPILLSYLLIIISPSPSLTPFLPSLSGQAEGCGVVLRPPCAQPGDPLERKLFPRYLIAVIMMRMIIVMMMRMMILMLMRMMIVMMMRMMILMLIRMMIVMMMRMMMIVMIMRMMMMLLLESHPSYIAYYHNMMQHWFRTCRGFYPSCLS